MTVQNPAAGSAVGRAGARAPSHVRRLTETKAFYKTSEFIVMLAAVVGVAIALNKNLTAWHGWLLITVLASAYMLSRGVAKAGSYEPYTERRDDD
jgi:ABC-type uncharacterized transport system permease subunit